MSNVQLLTVGSNPNVAFYAWRLYETGCVELSVANPDLAPDSPIFWHCPAISSNIASYSPHHLYSSPRDIPQSTQFDIVIISAMSLQDYQSTCAALEPLLHPDAIVVVESTGYVKLELVVHSSLPRHKTIPVLLIMNEADVRSISTNNYWHLPTGPDCRVYFGSSLPAEPELAKHVNFSRMYRLLQTVQQDSNGSINLLKSLSHREFMTYQWKLALPRIVFQPLSIIFEAETPQQLANQILCKPLVTGLIGELFKVIKKMECKLVKGFENETNLLNNQIACYSTPAAHAKDGLPYSNPLYYSYDKQQDLELDLLLLQPILLADDNGVRTPYLENLYSTMCQYMKINSNPSTLVFFERKRGMANNHASTQEYGQVTADLEAKRAELKALAEDLSQRTQHHHKTGAEIHAQEQKLHQLDALIERQQNTLAAVLAKVADAEARLLDQQQQAHTLSKEIDNLRKNRHSFDGGLEHYVDASIINASFTELVIQDTPTAPEGFELHPQGPAPAADHPEDPHHDSHHDSHDMPAGGALHPQPLTHSRAAPAVPYTQSQYNIQPMQGPYQAPPPQQPYQQPYQQAPPQQQQQQQQYAGQYNNGYQPANGSQQYQMPPPNPDAAYPYQNQGQGQFVQGQGQYYQHPNQRFQQPPQQFPGAHAPQQGMPGYAAPPHRAQRTTSNANVPHAEPQPMGGYPLLQIYAAPIDQLLEQRFKSNPKKQNRRSAHPQLRSVADGVDIGGRAGMPGPPSKHRPAVNLSSVARNMGSTGNLGEYGYAPQPQIPHSGPGTQQVTPPNSIQKFGNGADTHLSASSSTVSDTLPQNGHHNDVAAKPLGGIMPLATDDSKKKRGLFGKK